MVARPFIEKVWLGLGGSEAVDNLGSLRLVVGDAVRIETSATLGGSLVEHAEQVRHFFQGFVLALGSTDSLDAGADRGTDSTVGGIGLLGLAQTLLARFFMGHLGISGVKYRFGAQDRKIGTNGQGTKSITRRTQSAAGPMSHPNGPGMGNTHSQSSKITKGHMPKRMA